MNKASRNLDLARVFPTSNARGHHYTLARNEHRLPYYHERIRLKKMAQRKKGRREKEMKGLIRIATLNIERITGRGQVQEGRLRNLVEISEEQFGFMKGKSTTDTIFSLRELQEKFRGIRRPAQCVH